MITRIEVYEFTEDISMADWITQFAAVSRGKDKSNNPEKRLLSLFKEGAGDRPSRPVEYYPVMIPVKNLTEKQLYELSKFGYIEGGILHTNLRAVMIEGIDKNYYVSSDKRYQVFKVTVPKKVWAYLVMNPVATIVSNSARVISMRDTSLCTEEVTLNIGGYDNDIAMYTRSLSLIQSFVKDESIINTLKEIKDTMRSCIDPTNVPDIHGALVFDFNCSNDFTGYKTVQDIEVGELQKDEWGRPINNNEVRRILNGIENSETEVHSIAYTAPAFILYHLITHTEMVFTVSQHSEQIWFPSDMSQDDIDKAMGFIRRKEFVEVREFMKSLGYKKEIYNRYPNFAVMYKVEMGWRPSNEKSLIRLMKERNVIDYKKSNWTQKETTEILAKVYEKIKATE